MQVFTIITSIDECAELHHVGKTGEAFKKVRRSRKRPQPDEAAAAAGRSVVALLAEPLLPGAATATGIDQSGTLSTLQPE